MGVGCGTLGRTALQQAVDQSHRRISTNRPPYGKYRRSGGHSPPISHLWHILRLLLFCFGGGGVREYRDCKKSGLRRDSREKTANRMTPLDNRPLTTHPFGHGAHTAIHILDRWGRIKSRGITSFADSFENKDANHQYGSSYFSTASSGQVHQAPSASVFNTHASSGNARSRLNYLFHSCSAFAISSHKLDTSSCNVVPLSCSASVRRDASSSNRSSSLPRDDGV